MLHNKSRHILTESLLACLFLLWIVVLTITFIQPLDIESWLGINRDRCRMKWKGTKIVWNNIVHQLDMFETIPKTGLKLKSQKPPGPSCLLHFWGQVQYGLVILEDKAIKRDLVHLPPPLSFCPLSSNELGYVPQHLLHPPPLLSHQQLQIKAQLSPP